MNSSYTTQYTVGPIMHAGAGTILHDILIDIANEQNNVINFLMR